MTILRTKNQVKKGVYVIESNDLIQAKQEQDLIQDRVLKLLIHLAQKNQCGFELNNPVILTVPIYRDVFDTESDGGWLYDKVKEACLSLKAESFYENWHIEDRSVTEREHNWVQTVAWNEHHKRIEVVFTEAVKLRITELTECFTKYDLRQFARLRRFSSNRLYELLIRYVNLGRCGYSVEQLRYALNVPKTKTTGDFTRYYIEMPMDEINKYTDLRVTAEQEKAGRTIIRYNFTVQKAVKKAPKKALREREIDSPGHPSHLLASRPTELAIHVKTAVANAELAKIRKQLKIAPREENFA